MSKKPEAEQKRLPQPHPATSNLPPRRFRLPHFFSGAPRKAIIGVFVALWAARFRRRTV
jgi:hypothetical protein